MTTFIRRAAKAALALAAISASACDHPADETADLVLRGGYVYTVDSHRPVAESLAVRDDRIVYVGSDEGAAEFIGADTEVVDLGGKMVLPGFIDSHSHPGAYMATVTVDLRGGRTLEDYQRAVREFSEKNPGNAAIRGSGWSNAVFPLTGPKREDLDAVVADRPVALISGDGHSLWVNSKALELGGITAKTASPGGGVIEHDPETGGPTGTLRETAAELVSGKLPPFTVDERMEGLVGFEAMAARAGVTTVHDAALGIADAGGEPDPAAIEAYDRLEKEGKLTVRVRGSQLVTPRTTPDAVARLTRVRDENRGGLFEVNSTKFFVDGVVEGTTAALLEPYRHRPDYRGELMWDEAKLDEMSTAVDRAGLQLHFHAIGDRAVRVALDAIEKAEAANGERDRRPLITHLQLVADSDKPRFAKLGVIGVPQPFWFQKGGFYEKIEAPYLGEDRASREYPMQSLIDAGARMASASDFPVTVPFDPVVGIERGATRRGENATGDDQVLGPGERATVAEMIESFTYDGAYANFLEHDVGSLEVGKLADIVVVDRNLLEVRPEEIGEARVLLTLLEGREVFRDPALKPRGR
jgi:predicted amidohydrolase YtcJ